MTNDRMTIIREICHALDLDEAPEKCQSVTIKLNGGAPTVEVVRFITLEEGHRLKKVLERFELHEKFEESR
jgi:hypothetical protein